MILCTQVGVGENCGDALELCIIPYQFCTLVSSVPSGLPQCGVIVKFHLVRPIG